MVVIDAKDLIVGRMCAKAAKLAMKGERVDIVNCEEAIISGSKENILAKYENWDYYYYRTAKGVEIDLVLTKANRVIAIEIKS